MSSELIRHCSKIEDKKIIEFRKVESGTRWNAAKKSHVLDPQCIGIISNGLKSLYH